MDTQKQSYKVLIFPFLAYGHVSPSLELAKKLSQSNFHIHLCSTPINLTSIKPRITEKDSIKIKLIELHLPSLPELPPHYQTSNGLPLHLNHLLGKALRLGKQNFTQILKELQPDLLIHDILLPWAAPIAASNNIPSVTFFTSGAGVGSYFCHLFRHPETEFPFPGIHLTDFELAMALRNFRRGDENDDHDKESPLKVEGVILLNSSDEIEGKYSEYLSKLMDWDILPVGCLIPESNSGGDDHSGLVEWLAKKDEFSTVFVSFGSEYFLGKEEIEEIAFGLEMSNVNFIWVIRFAKGDEMRVDDVMPNGFLHRIGERGRVLDKWAPQDKILRHASIGGFVTHCGWNSILESIDFGVPIIAMPVHLDQPVNAKLVVELGVGVEVMRDVEGKFCREEISRVIKGVVLETRGKELRTIIGEKREKIRLRSREEMDGVVKKLNEICGKNEDA